MRADEFDKELNEAMPMGGLQSMGQKLRTHLPTFDPTGAAQAKGKLESGKLANKLVLDYNQFLGQLRQAPTPRNLLQFLTKAGYGTQGAIIDLKKNVRPAQPVKERAPTTSGTIGLVPKDLELEPMDPSARRKDVTNAPPAPTTNTATSPVSGTTSGKFSIANVRLNQKQINSALMAAATEYYAGETSSPSQPDVSQPATQAVAKQSGPGITKSFMAGLKGHSMPPSSGTPTPQIDFDDPRSINTLIRQMNSFVQGGGKLDPTIKQTLQKLITKL